jgi:hypothetical protein
LLPAANERYILEISGIEFRTLARLDYEITLNVASKDADLPVFISESAGLLTSFGLGHHGAAHRAPSIRLDVTESIRRINRIAGIAPSPEGISVTFSPMQSAGGEDAEIAVVSAVRLSVESQ